MYYGLVLYVTNEFVHTVLGAYLALLYVFLFTYMKLDCICDEIFRYGCWFFFLFLIIYKIVVGGADQGMRYYLLNHPVNWSRFVVQDTLIGNESGSY